MRMGQASWRADHEWEHSCPAGLCLGRLGHVWGTAGARPVQVLSVRQRGSWLGGGRGSHHLALRPQARGTDDVRSEDATPAVNQQV